MTTEKRTARLWPRAAQRTRKLCGLLRRLGVQSEISQTLATPAYAGLLRLYPRTPFKHLEERYLCAGLSARQRANCILAHYRALREKLPDTAIAALLREDVELALLPVAERRCALPLGRFQIFQDEGELSLRLTVDGQEAATLSFAIAPGSAAGCAEEKVLLLTRLQGAPRTQTDLRRITRTLRDVEPKALLLAGLQGVGEALGVPHLAAVSARRHRAYGCDEATEASCETLRQAYDRFFESLGVARNEAGFYACPLPPPQKPLTEIAIGHRARTRKKREFKQQIAAQACAAVKLLAESAKTADARQADRMRPAIRLANTLSQLLRLPMADL